MKIFKRINELLFIRNEDNKIEIDAEIYNILVSENIKEEENYGYNYRSS